jgi:microcin C transport system substrate-binding protein
MHSLNIQKLIEVDMRGDYDRLRTSADGYGIFTNKEIVPREYSVEKARAEFFSAGYDKLGSDGILANAAGEKLSFKFLTRDDPIRRRYALRLKEEALKCGVEFRVEAMDSTSAFKQIRDKRHELTYTAWASSPPYPRYWENFHGVNAFEKNPDGSIATEPNGTKKTKPNTNNITSTANPELDKLIDQYEKAQTLEDVERLAKACEQLVFDEASVMPSAAPASHRTGYWRWIRWPQHYNVKVSEYATTHHLHWIDQGLKDETLEARRSKQSFPPVETIYDQYRQKN